MRGLLKTTWTETKLYLREPMAAFFTLAFPLIYLFMFGAISGNVPTPQYGGARMLDAATPSLVAAVICIAGLMCTTMAIGTYREKGVLRRLRTTPVSPLVILGAQVIVVVSMTALGTLLLLVVGRLVYDVRFAGNPLSMAAGFLLSMLSFFAIGFVLASMLPTVRTTWAVSMVLLYPMMFLSGAFFTRDVLPAGVRAISDFMPLTYVVNLLQGLWAGEPWSAHLLDAGVLGGLLIVGTLISAEVFRWE